MSKHLEFTFCGLSDIGRNRSSNQDVWTAEPEYGFFALADGIGGRKGGDIAAKETIRALSQSIRQLDTAETSSFLLTEELRNAIEQANQWVYRLGCENEPLFGMGTTLCCLLWTREKIYYAHVGDSRIYRFRENRLELLTRDHSLFQRWVSKGMPLGPSSPPPPKNIITRAIGKATEANPEIAFCSREPEDLFLLCSDGLSDAILFSELQDILVEYGVLQGPSGHSSPLENAAKTMIERAKNKGSGDNITVLMIRSDQHHGSFLPR
jgi:protein phosphatase